MGDIPAYRSGRVRGSNSGKGLSSPAGTIDERGQHHPIDRQTESNSASKVGIMPKHLP